MSQRSSNIAYGALVALGGCAMLVTAVGMVMFWIAILATAWTWWFP